MAEPQKDGSVQATPPEIARAPMPKKATFRQKVPDTHTQHLKEFEIRLQGPGVEEMPSPMVVTALCPMDAFVEVTKVLKIDSTAYSFSVVNGPEDTE